MNITRQNSISIPYNQEIGKPDLRKRQHFGTLGKQGEAGVGRMGGRGEAEWASPSQREIDLYTQPHTPQHTDAQTQVHPRFPTPKVLSTRPPKAGRGPGPGPSNSGWMQPGVEGQKALRSFDSEYSSAFGGASSPQRGRGRKNSTPTLNSFPVNRCILL